MVEVVEAELGAVKLAAAAISDPTGGGVMWLSVLQGKCILLVVRNGGMI